eukprot:3386418-Prymnesium_polylepis.1
MHSGYFLACLHADELRTIPLPVCDETEARKALDQGTRAVRGRVQTSHVPIGEPEARLPRHVPAQVEPRWPPLGLPGHPQRRAPMPSPETVQLPDGWAGGDAVVLLAVLQRVAQLLHLQVDRTEVLGPLVHELCRRKILHFEEDVVDTAQLASSAEQAWQLFALHLHAHGARCAVRGRGHRVDSSVFRAGMGVELSEVRA